MTTAATILPGLVSITFRQRSPRELVELAARTGLRGIEWGGDVHVPHGDLARAREVAMMTTEAGLATASYGSYYVIGESEADGLSFGRVLETAAALGAPLIRVWAGKRGSAAADAAYRRRVAEEARRVAAAASAAGVRLAFEFHGGTLTDTAESAERLLADTAAAELRCYWQPPVGCAHPQCLESLRLIAPHLANLHVFHWRGSSADRRPLAEGLGEWTDYLRLAAAAPLSATPRWALLEYVRGDDPAQLAADAGALLQAMAASGPAATGATTTKEHDL